MIAGTAAVYLAKGMRVHDVVRVTLGRREFIAPRENKAKRQNGAHGVVSGILGRRDLLVLVMHEGQSTPAVYLPEELQLEPNAYWRVVYSQHGLGYFIELRTYHDVRGALDKIQDQGGKDVSIQGPFFSDKELTEGLLSARSLFDRLKND